LGKEKTCSECGSQYKNSKADSFKKNMIMKALKGIKVAGIKQIEIDTKNMCFDCWKKIMRAHMKPFAQALGESAEDW
jgi:hypothetical protein